MSRTVEFAEWSVVRHQRLVESVRLSQRLSASRKAGSSRVRESDDIAIITHMMQVELRRRVSEGRLVKLGPREYELHPRLRP